MIPLNDPQKLPKNYPKNDPPKLPLIKLIHAYQTQDRAEINIIRYMKEIKTKLFSSKHVRFSKKNSHANILAP